MKDGTARQAQCSAYWHIWQSGWMVQDTAVLYAVENVFFGVYCPASICARNTLAMVHMSWCLKENSWASFCCWLLCIYETTMRRWRIDLCAGGKDWRVSATAAESRTELILRPNLTSCCAAFGADVGRGGRWMDGLDGPANQRTREPARRSCCNGQRQLHCR